MSSASGSGPGVPASSRGPGTTSRGWTGRRAGCRRSTPGWPPAAGRIAACTGALAQIDPSAAAELAAAGAEAGAALEQFGAGLAARVADLPPAVPVGRQQYQWFLREVACIPLTVEEIAGTGRCEY